MSGLRCISPTLCPVGTELQIELLLSGGNEELLARGRTAWFRTIPNSDQFEFGIALAELDPQYKRRLSVYLERLSTHTGLVNA